MDVMYVRLKDALRRLFAEHTSSKPVQLVCQFIACLIDHLRTESCFSFIWQHSKKCNLEIGFRNPAVLVPRAGGNLPSGFCILGIQVPAFTGDTN